MMIIFLKGDLRLQEAFSIKTLEPTLFGELWVDVETMSDRPFKPLCYLALHVILRITSICIASHCILTCITVTSHSYMHYHHCILTCITLTSHSYMHYHRCILTCIIITSHSYMHHHQCILTRIIIIAFLHASPSLHSYMHCHQRILTCVTIIAF